MNMKLRTLFLCGLCALPCPPALAGDDAFGNTPDPLAQAADFSDVFNRIDSPALDFETGVLMRITDNTDLNYTVIPTIISFRSPGHWVWDVGQSALVVRSRTSLLLEGFAEGPETYYLGVSGSPSIEWWFPGRDTYLHFSVGGGFGWVDSQGVEGGQGQDLTYNWFIHGGLRHFISEQTSVSLGVYFQHNSNRGATDPNPGLDTFGPMVGFSRHF